VLFSLYHFFTPWQLVGRILVLLPMVYAVWWRRNIYIGMVVHCLGNTVTMLRSCRQSWPDCPASIAAPTVRWNLETTRQSWFIGAHIGNRRYGSRILRR
jgi:hypothetical protein